MVNITLDKTEDSSSIIKTPVFDIAIDNKNYVKLHAPEWVNVAVFNRDSCSWVLSKETRYGTGLETVEFMSGTVEEGEEPKMAALRELREEFGYDIENIVRIESLYDVNANPAFMDNQMHGYYIEVEGNPKEQKLDANEDVKPCEVVYFDDSAFENQGAFSTLTYMYLVQRGFLK